MSFVQGLETYVHERLSALDLLKEPAIDAIDKSEVVRRLKMALKNELEASEIAAVWIPTTPEVEVKLSLARQVGDEAKHYRLIGATSFPAPAVTDPCYSCLRASRRPSSESALHSPLGSRLH